MPHGAISSSFITLNLLLILNGDKDSTIEAEQTKGAGFEKNESRMLNNTALIPNASHMVNCGQPESVNSYILDFLSGDK